MKFIFIDAIILISLSGCALGRPTVQAPRVNLSFSPESEKYAEAANQDQNIWETEGQRIMQTMEEVSGLKFEQIDIRVIVYDGPSVTGSRNGPMKLNVRYPLRMTLLHELGHRLNRQITNPKDEESRGVEAAAEEHKILYLYLYDVWVRLYGKSFADNSVETEKKWKSQGFYFIESAWEWVLSMNEQERASKLKELVGKR